MVLRMRQENIQYFTEKEDELVSLLIAIGMKKNIAKMLVFLATTPVATSRAIERGTDMRQPEVSVAIKYLTEHGWTRNCESPPENKGRPIKVYELAKPLSIIIDSIGKEKEKKVDSQIVLIGKLRDFLR